MRRTKHYTTMNSKIQIAGVHASRWLCNVWNPASHQHHHCQDVEVTLTMPL